MCFSRVPSSQRKILQAKLKQLGTSIDSLSSQASTICRPTFPSKFSISSCMRTSTVVLCTALDCSDAQAAPGPRGVCVCRDAQVYRRTCIQSNKSLSARLQVF